MHIYMYICIYIYIYVYAGRGSLLSVEEIAGADIILTTYDALRSDVYHDGTPGRSLRGGKRYKSATSPLLQVVCDMTHSYV